MALIKILDENTIDKIAAGEVVDRPASIVKELVENAIDANASAITVEIKGGGIAFIRVTDNGAGIKRNEIALAFLRHATSKITTAEDLSAIKSLGFRGEALSSIAAVSQVEIITKIPEDLTGIRYRIEGSKEFELEEIGAPTGTTFLVRNIFFNTPARRKFLKSETTEGSYITDLMEHVALSVPNISIRYIINGKTRIHTSGNGDLKEIVYQLFGREITRELIQVEDICQGITLNGFVAKPAVTRGNRDYEYYFVNGRYVKSGTISKAVEEAYRTFLMLHKYPFVVLHLTIDCETVDVNVHPRKMEVRFANNEAVYDFVYHTIQSTLSEKELIPEVIIEDVLLMDKPSVVKSSPEPFETQRILKEQAVYMVEEEPVREEQIQCLKEENKTEYRPTQSITKEENITSIQQMEMFPDKLLSEKAREEYTIVGQVFNTYWIVAWKEKMYVIDQHAAHEKVLYERLMKELKNKEMTSQMLHPPIVITVNGKEENALLTYIDSFKELGFEIENFGGNEYFIRAVPDNLYYLKQKDLFIGLLSELDEGRKGIQTSEINERLASIACKAAVKGNTSLSQMELRALIDELLSLDNPYHCPHGRPTIISVTKSEIEKRFKRIVS